MADGLNPVSSIHQGIWTDYSRGRIWGLMWTLCPTHATIMTNTLAILVTVCGAQLWTLVRYTLYQVAASRIQRSSISVMPSPHFERRQRALRIATSDLSTAQIMLSLTWQHPRRNGRRSIQSFLIGVFALGYMILFWIAGIFSNKAISTTSTNGPWSVLSVNNQCGILNPAYYEVIQGDDLSTELNFNMWTQFLGKQSQEVQLSLEYAQECYLSVPNSNPVCNTLKAQNIGWETRNASCPFPSYMCHSDVEPIVFDTWYIDSRDDLGINAKAEDRLKYRRISTCSVLNDTGRIQGWDGVLAHMSDPNPMPQTAAAYFGRNLIKDTTWTYAYSNFASFYNNYTAEVTLPYQVNAVNAYAYADPQWSFSDFEPIPELEQIEADLQLFFLTFTGMYVDMIEDPWFSAHKEESFPSAPYTYLQSRYWRDEAIGPLACTVQHQFCTTNETCTGLLGFDQVQNNATFNATLTPNQNATMNRILLAQSNADVARVVRQLTLSTTPLLASNVTRNGNSGVFLSGGLAEDQWKRELNFWHSISMAHLQRTLTQWATGQIAPQPQYMQYLLPPAQSPVEDQDEWFCKSLVVPSMVYQSFSFASIIIVVGLGIVVVIFSLAKQRIIALIWRCVGLPPPLEDWDEDDLLRDRSPLPPAPPPKDDNIASVVNGNGLHRSVELTTFSTGRNDQRMSSPTLPAEDPSFLVSTPRLNIFSAPITTRRLPPSPPGRDSQTPVSLSDFDFAFAGSQVHFARPEKGERESMPTTPPPVARSFHDLSEPYQVHSKQTWI